jgi:methyltransferase (TIGR00027 family)
MFPGQASYTMVRTAAWRAAHQILDRPRIFDDPIVVGLVPEASEQAIRDNVDDHGSLVNVLLRAAFVYRSRFAEERLAQAAARGVRQYVIVGAGLDTFPWRQPAFAKNMRIFFVDHPSTLAWSTERFRERGLSTPPNVTFVAADLEALDLGARLDEYGFDRQSATFCTVLGVMQYISRDATEALLRFIASLPAKSEIVFTFSPPDDEMDSDALAATVWSVAAVAATGEPWVTRLRAQEVSSLLTSLGFREVFHLTPQLAQQRYFSGRTDMLKATSIEELFAATV